MAKVNVVPKIVREVVTRTQVVEQEEEIILRLSRREAELLASVCMKIGGDRHTPRGVFSEKSDSILEQLRRWNVQPHQNYTWHNLDKTYSGSISFFE